MNKVRVTKVFTFETAHALDGYHGKCKDIHGHSYKLYVTVLGVPINDTNISECGMVVDFGDLKKIVNVNIVDKFDHHLVLRSDSQFKGIEEKNERVKFVDYQPTAENMLLQMVDIVQKKLPANLSLVAMSLWETQNSFAEWRIEDNQ
jgi:6-pyruvoyltetrahydropterin/6-carboxytetrahydropterin synthase